MHLNACSTAAAAVHHCDCVRSILSMQLCWRDTITYTTHSEQLRALFECCTGSTADCDTSESVDGQTIGQPTGEFVRRTDNWSTHWRICRRTDIRSTHWRFCTSHSISNIQNLFISTIHRPRPTAAPATACSPPPTSTPNINMISIIGWHGYGSIQR